MKSKISKYPEPWRRALRRCTQAAALLAAMLMSPSCVNDNSVCIEDQPGYQEGKDVWLTFTIANQGESQSRSRAGAPTDPDHPDEAAVDAENYINPADVTIMFADNRGYIWKVWNVADGELTPIPTSKNEYEFKARVNQDYFNYASGDEIPFTLLVVANSKGTGAANGSYDSNDFMQTPWSLSKQYRSFTFNPRWMPEVEKAGIPMSGLVKASMTRDAFDAATDPANAANMGTIYLQRNIAKVRVVDALAKNGDTDHRITAVTLVGATTQGSFLPYMTDEKANWASGTAVMEEATVKDASWYNAIATHTLSRVRYDDVLKLVDQETVSTYDAFSSYITEYDYSRVAAAADRPKLLITVDGSEGQLTYEYPVSNALGASDMVRNHIYQFVVEGVVNESNLSIDYCVCPWTDSEIIIPPFN